MAKEYKIKISEISTLPKEPGIYLFYGKAGELFYIGKANDLRKRVKTHFSQPNYKDNLFINKVKRIGYIPLFSEVEALLLESQLIKKYQPKFNILFRDDKKYFYVGITKESWPRIFLTHQPTENQQQTTKNKQSKKQNLKVVSRNSNVDYIGPFTDGSSLKEVLKFLRKIFPYRSCKSLPKRPCLWYDLNRCPAPCLIEKEKKIRKAFGAQTEKRQKEYKEDIKKLKEILEGKRKKVINQLKKQMEKFSQNEEFEKAAILRDKIMALEKVFSHRIIFEEKIENGKKEEKNEGEALKRALYLKRIPKRIEGYDVSNIQSSEMVGAMVVFSLKEDGNYVPEKKEYRLFKIKTIKKQNDIACLKEIISRRLKHKEWQMPDLIYVDGGKAQFNAAFKTLQQITDNKQLTTDDKRQTTDDKRLTTIPVISLAKKTNILYTSIFGTISLDKLEKAVKMTILRIKDETHRFAIKYHRKLREKKILTS